MTELVFYDHRLPLKRKWSDSANSSAVPSHTLQPLAPPPRTQQLPRLPSLSAWTNVQPRATSPVLPPASILTPPPPPAPVSPSHASEAPPAKKAAPMRNTSRERMKAEQASLRAQAVTLETELACLRQLRHERLAACLRSSEKPSEGLLGWQDMAQRHWDQRVASERENKLLREAVNGLATEVKGLESLFNSRSSALMASLQQNAQFANEIETMLAKHKRFHEALRRPTETTKTSSPAQHSPRDVACAMEAPQSPCGL